MLHSNDVQTNLVAIQAQACPSFDVLSIIDFSPVFFLCVLIFTDHLKGSEKVIRGKCEFARADNFWTKSFMVWTPFGAIEAFSRLRRRCTKFLTYLLTFYGLSVK